MTNRSILIATSLVAVAGCAANVDDPGANGADGAGEFEAASGRVRAGDVIAYGAETPHPYVGGWKRAITSPGATFVRVHFTGFSLAKGDHVTVSSPDGAQSFRYVQHPGGGPKEVGYWRDAAQTLRCQVDTRNQTYDLTTSRTQVGYSCDTAGGSSGSPVIHGVSGKVVALHHLGNVGLFTCRNGGTQMSAICADAGDLLDCASD
ncbi:trypsin-like peptidase domain-containing protein [Sorangium sp. So ce1036]|uniref:trypsin-like peptidase domain-containing protein n=1 Tax=Sorangium sp. So ce1036 TaxID=3133328 RepID=UPI003F040CDB